MKNTVPVLCSAFLLLLSCSTDSESDLMNSQPNNEENELVTYNDDIRTIINNNCISCHSNPPVNGAPFPLSTYNEVKIRAENGLLLTAISRQTGETRAMPPAGRLPQNTIDLVEQWIADGLLED